MSNRPALCEFQKDVLEIATHTSLPLQVLRGSCRDNFSRLYDGDFLADFLGYF